MKHFGTATLVSILVLTTAFPGVSSSPPRAFVYPLVGTQVSSKYGDRRHPILKIVRHHEGVDLVAPSKAPVRSIADGVVVFASRYGGYGNLVVVRHSGQMTSHYGHLDKFSVRPGQHTKAGQILGEVGTTGRVTGPHLHFEVRIDGKVQDPQKYIKGLALPAQG